MKLMNRINLPALIALGIALVVSSIVFTTVAYAQAANVTIRWTAPTQHTDNTAITATLTYNVYSGPKGAAKTKLGSTSAGITTFVASNVAIGTCFAVTAVEAGVGESAQSAEACTQAVPKPPGALTFVTITVTTVE